ncbi:hypothetical protein O0L34_g9523 [Tuta absoluta]|nr:hypothetical protein O0L34_g9523 [Tuta absoluta]
MLKLTVLLVTILVIFGYVESKKMVELSPEKMSSLLQSSFQCSVEVGVDPMEALKNRAENENIDTPTKKFMLCMFVNTGIAKKDGDIKASKFLKVYPDNVNKEEIKPVIEECRQKDGTPEDKIVKFLDCYKKKSPVLINFGR